nr:hypothetical protein [uncultured Desulfobulbus sp.]
MRGRKIAHRGGLDQQVRAWKKLSGKYLFNSFALAKAFRGKFLAGVAGIGLRITNNVPKKWGSSAESVVSLGRRQVTKPMI